ncbi:TPA: hypothetical protein ACV8DY_003392, partial [Escherichia coli]
CYSATARHNFCFFPFIIIIIISLKSIIYMPHPTRRAGRHRIKSLLVFYSEILCCDQQTDNKDF